MLVVASVLGAFVGRMLIGSIGAWQPDGMTNSRATDG